MSQWQSYSEKFNNITPREQYLIIATGLVAIIFVLFSLFLDAPFQRIEQLHEQVSDSQQSSRNNQNSIDVLEQALSDDPNVTLKQELAQYQTKLGSIDEKLLTLTSDLIDPVQMRYALIKLLKLQSGVKLLSFEVLPARPVTKDNAKSSDEKTTEQANKTPKVVNTAQEQPQQLRLYRHGIKIKLQGRYFQLRDYLTQLENLSWTFFWQGFDYQLKAYPQSELEVEIYSLSTAQEFIGV